MLDTVIIVVLALALAIVTGMVLDQRTANLRLQQQHARAQAWDKQTIAWLRWDVNILGAACDRWAQFDRVQVRKISDQARTIHDLTTELDELKVQHAKAVLGGVEISDEQQAAIDSRLSQL